jgi:hypothetical protein
MFNFTLLSSEGREGEDWETSNKTIPFLSHCNAVYLSLLPRLFTFTYISAMLSTSLSFYRKL